MRLSLPFSAPFRALSVAVVSALVGAALVAVTVSPVDAATGSVTVSATPDSSVLAGSPVSISMTARNPSATPEYNATFQYTLPAGVTYTGPTTPTSVGSPTIATVTDAQGTHQVLVWSNVSDLVAGDSSTISFTVTPSTTAFPVGASVTGSGAVYTSEDARTVPDVDPATGAITGDYDDTAVTGTVSTTVSALKVTKSEPSPEHELPRGVHDHQTVYTVQVQNTAVAATNTVTVQDYLPADLEFLGCGGVDNSTGVEYPGAARISATPAPNTGGNCLPAASVTTVQLTNDPSGLADGVYTLVTWNVASLPAGTTRTIEYVAGIPQRANAMWTGTPPTGTAQTANLDNNTGPSTQQVGAGKSAKNTAIATGTYAGPVASGTSTTVSAQDSVTVTETDLAIQKRVSSPATDAAGDPAFSADAIATYSLDIESSEYESDSAMTITDVLDDGLCPAYPTSVTPTGDPLPADCSAANDSRLSADATNAHITALSYLASTGKFTLTMQPTAATLGRSASTTISYTALMRTRYSSATQSGPTASGDSFGNTVTINGTSTTINDTDAAGTTHAVTNPSGASLSTDATTISKAVLSRTAGAMTSAAQCAAAPSTGYSTTTDTANPFQLGDDVCFRLTVDFAASTMTRNAQITDMVPVGTTYKDWAYGSTSTIPTSQVVLASSNSTEATWNLGAADGSNGDYVAKGSTAVVYVLAAISKQGSSETTPDLVDNLMKYQQANTAGAVSSLRTSVGYVVASAPKVGLSKSITAKDGSAITATSATSTIEGQALGYTLHVTNPTDDGSGTAKPVSNVVVWDALPAGITCGAVSTVSAGGACAVGAPSGGTLSAANAARSVISWTIPSIAVGGSADLTYTLTVPAGTDASSVLTNDSSVTRYQVANTAGGSTTYRPGTDSSPKNAATLDTTALGTGEGTAPAANASATATMPAIAATKTGAADTTTTNSSGQPLTNDTTTDHGVPGQGVSYTYTGTVPAHATVHAAVLSDNLPAGVSAAHAVYTLTLPDHSTQVSRATDTSANSFVWSDGTSSGTFSLSTSGALTFPSPWDNATATDEPFSITVSGVTFASSASGAVTNTATFATAKQTLTPAKTLTVDVPAPSLSKTVSATTVGAGKTVVYTFTAWNTAVADGYDSVVADCLPSGLTFDPSEPLPSGITATAVPSGYTCATGTAYAWSIGKLAAGTSSTNGAVTFTRTATVTSSAASTATYTNTATVRTSSLNDGAINTGTEATPSATASAPAVTVASPMIAKQVAVGGGTPANSVTGVRVGDTVTYTIKATVPADVNLYNASVVDTLQSGQTAVGTPTCSVDSAVQQCSQLTSGSTVMFVLGKVTTGDAQSVVTIVFQATLPAGTNTAAATYANTAKIQWNTTNGSDPTSATQTAAQSVPSNVTSVTTQRPALTIAKKVDGLATETITPNTTFTYSVTVKNTGQNPAYDVAPSDTIPTGVVLSTPLPTGATLTGAGANGGGTITFPSTTIAAGATTTYTYTATFATSTSLTKAHALANSISTGSYRSLEGAGATYSAVVASASVVPALPDVTLTKTAQSGPAYVGMPFRWTVDLRNGTAGEAGLGASKSEAVTDTLPANWAYVAGSAQTSTDGTTWTTLGDPTTSTSGASQQLAWTLGGIPAASHLYLRYTSTPTAAALTTPGTGESVAHTNAVAAVVTDLQDNDHSATGSYAGPAASADAHIDRADLVISKKAVATAPVAGGGSQAAWTIAVTNNGPDTAVGPFTVTDTVGTLPAGAVVSGATGTGWTCDVPNGGTTAPFTCTATGDLANGASLSAITVSVTIPSATTGTTIANSATVSDQHTGTGADGSPTTFGTHDPDSGNNTDQASITTTTKSVLSIVKGASASAHAGDSASPVTWTLDVTNAGPSDTHGTVEVTDTIPSSVTPGTATGSGWSCSISGQAVDCTTTTAVVANGAASRITVTGVIASGTTGAVSNSAKVGWTDDRGPQSATSNTTTTTVDTSTTLGVTKTLGSFTPGETGVYTIAVSDTGTADARGVTVTDPLPAGMTFASAAATSGDWTCTADAAGTTVTCTLAGTIAAGHDATVSLTVNVPADVRGTDVENTATATATNASEAATGSAFSESTPTTTLSIDKSHPADLDLVAGNTFPYTVTVTNDGPSAIVAGERTTVVDTLPAAETYVPNGSVGDGWTVAQDGQTLTFTTTDAAAVHAALPAITYTVRVAADAPADTAIRNTVTASSAYTTSSVTDTDVVTPRAQADVSVTKTLDRDSSTVAGTDATWRVSVTNDGPSAARDVTLRDVVPAGLTVTALTADTADGAWTCDGSDCTIGVLEPGTTTFAVTTAIASSVRPSTLTNAADVDWSDSRGVQTAEDTADVAVTNTAALSLTKAAVDADGKPVQGLVAGTDALWKLVVHDDGPSDASGDVQVTDTLPTGLTYGGVTDASAASGWSCEPQSDGSVVCDLQQSIANGADAPDLVIVTAVDPSLPAGDVTNTAFVHSTTTPGGTGTQGASDTVPSAPDVNLDVAIAHSGTGTIGGTTPFTVTVANKGPSTATGVSTTVTLPKGLTFTDTDGTDAAWTAGTPVTNADGTTTIVFTLTGTLAPGTTAPPIVVDATVTPGAYPSATVTASVSAAETETTMADNTADDALPIAALSSLSVTKTHTMALVRGRTLAYTITVHNDGPTADPGPVRISDALPTGLSAVSVDGRGAATCVTGGTIDCTLSAPLAADTSVAVVLTVTVAGNAPGSIVNEAVVTTPTAQVAAGSSAGDPLPGATSGHSTASDPGSVSSAPNSGLAFTGSTGVLWAVLAALVALAAGLVARFLPRRRRRRRA